MVTVTELNVFVIEENGYKKVIATDLSKEELETEISNYNEDLIIWLTDGIPIAPEEMDREVGLDRIAKDKGHIIVKVGL